MRITTKLLDTMTPRPSTKALSGASGAPAVTSVSLSTGLGMQFDATQKRAWRDDNPWIFSAIMMRRQQVANATWDIQPINPKEPFDKDVQKRIQKLLDAPNPEGKNNSFGSLFEPVVDDVLCLDSGAILPYREGDSGEPIALEALDGARVVPLPNWRSNDDGPRYIYNTEGQLLGDQLRNDQLIHIQANAKSYEPNGLSPLTVLRRTLIAEFDTFKSIHILQRNRAPSSLLVVPNTSPEVIDTIKDMFLNELAGKSTIGVAALPSESNLIELGSTNLAEQGAFAFYDMLVRAIATSFRTTTLALNWVQDINRGTAREQADLMDDGIFSLLRLLQGYINREVVAFFPGSENLRFSFTQLITADEASTTAAVRDMAGRAVNPYSINQMCKAAGVPTYDDVPESVQPWYDEPTIQVAAGSFAPLSVAATLPQYQPLPPEASSPQPTPGSPNTDIPNRATPPTPPTPGAKPTPPVQPARAMATISATKFDDPDAEVEEGDDEMRSALDEMFGEIMGEKRRERKAKRNGR